MPTPNHNARTADEAATFLADAVRQANESFSAWTVEISQDPGRRLDEVMRRSAYPEFPNLIVETPSHQVALDAKRQLIDLGFDGQPGGGDKDSVYVIIYRGAGTSSASSAAQGRARSQRPDLATPAEDLVTGSNSDLFRNRK